MGGAQGHWNLLDRDVLSWYAVSPNRELFLQTVQEFRHIIEPEATALAAERRTEEQMGEISQALHDMAHATSLQRRTEADTRFHVAILRASGNELLVPLGVLIELALNHLFVHVTREDSSLQYAQKLHEDIERCIRLQRPNAARRAVRKLLAYINTDVRSSHRDKVCVVAPPGRQPRRPNRRQNGYGSKILYCPANARQDGAAHISSAKKVGRFRPLPDLARLVHNGIPGVAQRFLFRVAGDQGVLDIRDTAP